MPSPPLLHNPKQGFTLIEVSIVLVIIGLVIGSVLAGKHLVRQSELQSVMTDVNAYTTAVNTFRVKYDAFPGDMPNATDYWGTDSNCPATTANAIPKQATCNGDGTFAVDTNYELFRVWQHLANAKLIPGQYTGTVGVNGVGSTNFHVPGVNCPATRLSGGGFAFWYLGSMSGNANWFDVSFAHMFRVGRLDSPTYNGIINLPLFTPLEALGIDVKMDDGLPASGRVVTYRLSANPSGGCASSDTASAAVYDISNKAVTCVLMFDTRIK